MSKRGHYGTNKTGSGLLYLERICLNRENNKDFIIGLTSPSHYPSNHNKDGEENRLIFGSGFNKVKHTHIGQKHGYICYKNEFDRDYRLILVKRELENYGYEIEVRC